MKGFIVTIFAVGLLGAPATSKTLTYQQPERESADSPELLEAARLAAKLAGVPVNVIGTITFTFSM